MTEPPKRGRGRPAGEDPATYMIGFKMRQSLAAELERLAEAQGVSVHQLAREATERLALEAIARRTAAAERDSKPAKGKRPAV